MCEKCSIAQRKYDDKVDAAYDIYNLHKAVAKAELDRTLKECKQRYELCQSTK